MQKLKTDMNIGNNMRKLRKKNGYTQDQIIAQLERWNVKVIRSTYSRYETGELNVPISVLVGLQNIFKCSYDEFFTDLSLNKLY